MTLDQFTRPARNLVLLGMLLPSLSMSVAAFLAHRDHLHIQTSYDWIMRTLRVQGLINGLVADIVQVETDQRGFLLTGRHSYLRGKWISFEKYLERRFNIDITHGISPRELQKVLASLPLESGQEPNDRAESA